MSKLIRFDEDHFGFLAESLTDEQGHLFMKMFQKYWPGKRLIVMQADEFVDLTGQYEIVPIPEGVVV